MGHIRLHVILIEILLIGILHDLNAAGECFDDALRTKALDIKAYKQKCLGRQTEGSALKCLLRKIARKCSEDSSPDKKTESGAFCVFAWLNTLPVLKANTAIINEIPDHLSSDEGPLHNNIGEHPMHSCMYYRVDYASHYSLLRQHPLGSGILHHSGSETWDEKLFPKTIKINASAAHTTPFAEKIEVKLHFVKGAKNTLTWILFYEPFQAAVQLKSKIRLRMRIDIMWPIRSRFYIAKVERIITAVVLRYRNKNVVNSRLRKYNLIGYNGNATQKSIALPFLYIEKGDFYRVISGTSLLDEDDFLASICDEKSDDENYTLKINVTQLLSNLIAFIKDNEKFYMEKAESFYVAEICVYNAVYSFYNIMGSMVSKQLWQQPARYMVTSVVQSIHLKRITFRLLKYFALATIMTIIFVGMTFRMLNVASP
ncbi:putative membrane protein [Babesia divergens]|uniref:Membrane protein n=1 Tax=Babesia divergens TaxID=32595 RepID=A0AAD9GHT6_BABDI|nr:putative membrane protein [Babesia divergens]